MRRRGRLWGWGWLRSLIRRRFGWRRGVSVIKVLADGIANGLAPGVGAEGVDVLVLGEMDGLDEGLGEIGDGSGGARFDIAADDGREEAAEGGA
jgi:transposase InsO family protein